MFERALTVRYITSKNCFCTLSLINFKPLQSKAVTLTYNDKKAYVSVNSTETLDDDSIGINSLYAKTLGIEDKSLITVSEIVKPPTIQSVTVTAISRNDHDILELLAESVQSTLLEQIRVLNNGQKFVIWIGNSINITVLPFDIKPIAPGSLDFLTEVVIKPPSIKEIKSTDNKKIGISKNDIFADYRSSDRLVLRLVPFTKLSEKLGELNQPFNVFVFKSTLSQNLPNTLTNPHIYSVKLLSDDISEEKITYIRLFVFEDFIDNFKLNSVCSENIYVSETLLDYFNCGIGARALLQFYNGTLPEVDEIEICTKRNYSINAKEVFQQYLADNCKEQPFILNPQIVLNFDKDLKCFLRFHPPEAKFCFVNQDFVRNFKLSVSIESIPQKEILEEDQFYADNYTTEVANYQDIVNKSVFLIIHDKKIHCNMYNILITGKTGTGKTTLLKIINSTITSFPYFIYTKQINCKSIKGKTVESLHKLFVGTMFDLIHHQPSILILDDLHILCENVKENDAFAQNTIYFNRVSEMLEGLFQNFCECNTVGILATANSTTKLNKNIYATRGNHFFKNVYSINPLENIDRRRLLKYFFSDCTYSDSDVAKLAEKSESFVIQDVVDLANKTLFESCQEGYNDDVITITLKHCEKALESVRMASLDGVNLHNAGDRDLDDIGGLNDVKKILIETMLWPSKHPNLFSNAPLRLPSGLLLYGPPGTGKTILAGAAAKHCGLRLISIKGPELLSKYIGASEQAVRDVFQRAQSAKPCVLFFDEFDSLAPRRGHDNTGVTDRVVNQLLTQLDGIESLSGVFVLAATSRPDLLDPALLRPGRLDRHIRCSLPDETSRLEILKVLSKKLRFSSDVDLAEMARLSEGFSGADLQAVLYSAQLESVKHVLEDEENSQELQPEIQHTQLLEALRNTRPSLSNTEQIKYEQIYCNFEGNSGSNFTPGTRATLA